MKLSEIFTCESNAYFLSLPYRDKMQIVAGIPFNQNLSIHSANFSFSFYNHLAHKTFLNPIPNQNSQKMGNSQQSILIQELINIQRCMLNTTLSKLSQEQKNKPLKHSERDDAFIDTGKGGAKNVFTCFNTILKQKYGRKFKVKQVRQGSQKRGSKYISKGPSEKGEIQLLREKYITPKLTLYWQNRPSSIKRHTYNHHCHTSGREGEPDNDPFVLKQESTKSKNGHPVSHTVKSQQLLNRSFIQRRIGQKRGKISQIDVSQVTEKQINLANNRIFPKHSKFTSIELTQTQEEKSPLVDLIKKYGFQNLKTLHLPQSNAIQLKNQNRKYVHEFIKTQPLDQTTNFFTEQPQTTNKLQEATSRKPNKTSMTHFRKYERSLINKTTNKLTTQRSSSILTPWATEGDTVSTTLQ